MPSTATPSALASCWTAFSTPDADPTSSIETPASTKSNSWPKLAPAPRPIRTRLGVSSSVSSCWAPDGGQRQRQDPGADQRDADVEQMPAELADQRERGDHRDDHPDGHRHVASGRRGSARTARRAGRTARSSASARRTSRTTPAPTAIPLDVGAVAQQRRLDQRRLACAGARRRRTRPAAPPRRRALRRSTPASRRSRPWISG